MRIHFVYVLLLYVPLCLAGCGEQIMAPVKGRVLCHGKPVKEAQVTFSPKPKSEKDLEPGKPGTGFTDEEGIFVLSTYKELDGAQIGEHNVNVVLDDTNPAKCKRVLSIMLEVKPGPNDFSLELKP
jgi:hypothetical protein